MAILQAARELLQTGGPDLVTHAQVAVEANVSRTTVYKHYPSRAALIRAAIEVGTPFEQERSGDLREDLFAFVEHLVEEFSDDHRSRMFLVFMERAMSDPELAQVRDEMSCVGADLFRELIEDGIATGRLRADLDVDLAQASLLGAFMYRRFMSNEPIDHEGARRVVDAFIAQHAPR